MNGFKLWQKQNENQKIYSLKRRIVLFSILMIMLYGFITLYRIFKRNLVPKIQSQELNRSSSTFGIIYSGDEITLPSVTDQNQVIAHNYYTLSYSEEHEQSEWVAYELTLDRLNASKLTRMNYFTPDPTIVSGSATHFDYMGSGYDRGHLAAAADMSFDHTALEESFMMSNISPQLKSFNSGIWRELEEDVRDWARKYHRLYIVTGPVLKSGIIKKIGKNKVSVPGSFYKVVLDLESKPGHGVGFIIPNALSELPLEQYMVSIDSVENITGLDFFNYNHTSQQIESIEKEFRVMEWKIIETRYLERVAVWNKRE